MQCKSIFQTLIVNTKIPRAAKATMNITTISFEILVPSNRSHTNKRDK